MMKRILSIFLILGMTTNAWGTATTTKQIDNIQNSTGGSSLAVPSTGANVVSDSATQTLTNKTMSGASNTFSAIPVSAIATGTALGVNAGGTGDITLTTNGMLYGNGTSAAGITAAGSQYQVFQAGASGVPTVGALNLGQAAATTGQLPVGAGGTGLASLTLNNVLIGNGASNPTFVAPSSNGNVLTSNGTTWISSAPSAAAPVLNATQAAPQSVTAAGGISLSGLGYVNVVFIKSNSGAVTVTATPSVTACTAAGQLVYVLGEDASNTVKLQDESALAGAKLRLNGNWTSGLNSMLSLLCDGNGFWIEVARAY
jgi:hypothetical protein